METTDSRDLATRFSERYRRWDGAIPLDDLSPYQAWNLRQAPQERNAFRILALLLTVRASRVATDAEVRLIVARFRVWIPQDG